MLQRTTTTEGGSYHAPLPPHRCMGGIDKKRMAELILICVKFNKKYYFFIK